MTDEELDGIEARALAAGPGAALRRSEPLPADELDTIEARAEATGPGPWETFIESDAASGAARQDIPRLVEAVRRS